MPVTGARDEFLANRGALANLLVLACTRLAELKIGVFEAVRERIISVAGHARASTVAIDWRHASDAITVSVIDDGVGFDVDGKELRRVSEGGFGGSAFANG